MNDILNEIYRNHPDIEIIMLTKFGSHLYGTDTPESDTDYKGIFMPSKRMICLGKIPKSINNNKKKSEGEKNTADDVDFELYSFQYFIELACQGQTSALDILHANSKNIIKSSPLWGDIVYHRKEFYTKSLEAFVGYARRQASKYGIKGSRLKIAKGFLRLINTYDHPDVKMKEIWHILPTTDHSGFIDINPNGIRQYMICGKIIQETVTIEYAYNMINLFVKAYGKRAELAAKNEGIDWKAISHALRAAYQVREILKYNTITFPLIEADFLREVKQGKHDYTNHVAPILENLMEEVEILSDKSILPKKVNRMFWEDFVFYKVHYYLNKEK